MNYHGVKEPGHRRQDRICGKIRSTTKRSPTKGQNRKYDTASPTVIAMLIDQKESHSVSLALKETHSIVLRALPDL